MSKALKIVGAVVAVVAVVATATATFGASLGLAASVISAATTVASVAAAVGGVLALVSALVIKPPGFTNRGNPLQFSTNPNSGLPYAIGRTKMAGLKIFGETRSTPGYTKAEDLLFFAALLSAGGTIDSIEKFTIDNQVVTFDGSGQAIGSYNDWMAMKTSLGGSTALSLSLNGGTIPLWGASHKISGMAHALWALRFDADGEKFQSGVPQPAWIGKWVKVYDPRKDDTYPGGSGSHRALDETTYEWSRNPALHALTWALGRFQNGERTLGIGAPVANIRVSDFVNAANISDTNEWTCGGVEYSDDSKWDILKRMLQAAGSEPSMTGAMIGCRTNTPRIAVTSISAEDLLEDALIVTNRRRRDRINSSIPRYRSEAHDWQVISGSEISVSAYVTEDGRKISRETDFPLVQNEVGQAGVNGDTQAGQLTAYQIVNAREAGPITIKVGPEFVGVKKDDCVTLNLPEEGLDGVNAIITSRNFDPSGPSFTFTLTTETDSKHAFALGQSTTPPPAFALTPPDNIAPAPGSFSATSTYLGGGQPGLLVSGTSDFPSNDHLLIRYRKTGEGWTAPVVLRDSHQSLTYLVGPLDPETSYEIGVAYSSDGIEGEWATLGPYTTPVSLNGFPPGIKIGVLGDVKLTKNYSTSGPNNGEIKVEGTAIFLPDFGKRTLPAALSELATRFEGAYDGGTFYVIAGSVAAATRFGSAEVGSPPVEYFFCAKYDWATGDWTVYDNAGSTFPYTPIESDAIIAVGTKIPGTTGITTLVSLIDYWADLPDDNADVTGDNVPMQTGPASITFTADYTGTIPAGQLNVSKQARRFQGSTDVTTSAVWSIQSPSGCTVSIGAATGIWEISACTTSGSFIVRSVHNGVTIDVMVSVTKTLSPAPTSTGVTVTDTSIASFGSSGTHETVTSTMIVTTGPTGRIDFTAPLTIYTDEGNSPSGVSSFAGKWRWRVLGGSFADVSTEITSSSNLVIGSAPEYLVEASSSIAVTQAKTGLGANTQYEVQLQLRRKTGSGTRTFYSDGTATAIGS